MSGPFTPEQEDRIREIVAEMIGQFTASANDRLVDRFANPSSAKPIWMGLDLAADADGKSMRDHGEDQ